MAAAGIAGAPPSPLNVRIGPHRRFAWASADLALLKATKNELGGTINDVVLTVVAGALRAHLFRHGRDPEGLELKAMVPISVRADSDRGALGNQVAAMYAPLPVGIEDPVGRFRFVHHAMRGLKESGQAVGAQAITRLADAAAPTVLDQAARLQSRQRFFNLTVTNVPGPQVPLYLMGRRLEAFYPKVPLVLNTALGIAIMSYDGRVFFGLLGDFDALADLDTLAGDVDDAIRELAAAAGAKPAPQARASGRRRGREAPRAARRRRVAGGGRVRRPDLAPGVARLEPARRLVGTGRARARPRRRAARRRRTGDARLSPSRSADQRAAQGRGGHARERRALRRPAARGPAARQRRDRLRRGRPAARARDACRTTPRGRSTPSWPPPARP